MGCLPTSFDTPLMAFSNGLLNLWDILLDIFIRKFLIFRVPLLCPCCTQIKSISFHRVTKCASYIMQMQEIALLRSKIEKHLLNHLEINWRIEQLNVCFNLIFLSFF